MKTYTLIKNGKTRSFTLRTYRTMAASSLIAKLGEQVMDVADDHERGLALIRALAEDEKICDLFMKSALEGDHEGIVWLFDAPDTLVFEVVTEYMRAVLEVEKNQENG